MTGKTTPEKILEISRTIPVQGPFRFATALNVMTRFESARRDPDLSVRFSFSHEVSGGAVEVILRQKAPGEPLDMRVLGDLASDTVADDIVGMVIRAFSLHVDPTDYFQLIAEDQHLHPIIEDYPDLRPVQYLMPFEGVVRLLISHRLTPEQSSMLVRNLVEVCGVVPRGRPFAAPAFPGKHTLLAAPERLIRIAGIPMLKIRKIKEVCAHLVGEPDLLEYLLQSTDPLKVRALLEELPKIGRRSAEHLLLHAYGFQDYLPDDPRIFRAVRRFYQLEEQPDDETVRRIAQPYTPWRAWWVFLLECGSESMAGVR